MPLRQVRYIYPCPSIIILQLPDFLTSRNRSQSVPPIRPTPFLTWSIYAFFFFFLLFIRNTIRLSMLTPSRSSQPLSPCYLDVRLTINFTAPLSNRSRFACSIILLIYLWVWGIVGDNSTYDHSWGFKFSIIALLLSTR